MYQLTPTTSIIRISDGAIIPDDQRNTDWQIYQQWLADGNVPDESDAPDESAAIEAIKSQAKEKRDTILARLRWIQFDAYRANETDVVTAIDSAIVGLQTILTIQGVTNATTAQDAKNAILARYYELGYALQIAAPSAVIAFEGFES